MTSCHHCSSGPLWSPASRRRVSWNAGSLCQASQSARVCQQPTITRWLRPASGIINWPPSQPGCSRAAASRSRITPSHSGSEPSRKVTRVTIVIMMLRLPFSGRAVALLQPLLALATDGHLRHGGQPRRLDRPLAFFAHAIGAVGQPLQRAGEPVDAPRHALALREAHVDLLAGLGDVARLEWTVAATGRLVAFERQAQAGQLFDGGATFGQQALANRLRR